MHEQVFPLSSHLLGQIGPRAPKSQVSEKPIRREPVQNPKPRHFKPFEFFDHTGSAARPRSPRRAANDDEAVTNGAGGLAPLMKSRTAPVPSGAARLATSNR